MYLISNNYGIFARKHKRRNFQMGLFDKFSKKKADDETENTEQTAAENEAEKETEAEEADAAETEEKEPEAKAEAKEEAEAKAQPERKEPERKEMPAKAYPTPESSQRTRFTLVVENVFAVDGSVVCVGNLHGRISKGDSFFLIHPKYPAGILANADTLVVGEETPEFAENCRVAVKTSAVDDPKEVPKYTVLSNVAPQVRPDPSKPLENPFLVGLTCEYNRFVKDSEFTYTFMAGLLTARYITPADMQLEAPDENGRTAVKNSKISFKLLRNPNDPKTLALPIFTDMAALRLWKGALDGTPDGEKPKTLLMPFERCAEIGLKNSGVVINPFGPAPVLINNMNIQNTLNLGKQALAKQKELEEKK